MADLVDITDRTPNPDLIAMLERMIADAKAGELRSAVVVCGWQGDRASSGWQLDARTSGRKLLGEIAVLQFDFLAGLAVREGDGTFARIVRGE